MDLRWAGSDINRMQALAQELVRLQPDIIVATSTPATVAVQRETRTIPIVFGNVSDPVVMDIVAALNQPSGNITGFAFLEVSLGGKWLELLSEIAPGSSGPQSCLILTRLSHRLLCHHLRRPRPASGVIRRALVPPCSITF
jgi:hypothetical protein